MIGAVAALVGVGVAAFAVPMALSQLREQRRQQAIQLYIDAVNALEQASVGLAEAWRAFPSSDQGHKETGRLIVRVGFLTDVIRRSRIDASDYISDLDISGVCYLMAIASEPAERVLDQFVSDIMPTADPHRWTERAKADAISWCWQTLMHFRKFPSDSIARQAGDRLFARLEILQNRPTAEPPGSRPGSIAPRAAQ
ncbi:MAG: hypothetical protein K2X34_08665 [Hyphomonadaceae bacterium]|nr:hypothetical protein [Hyphomonadaceae bacterium]